jgi:glycerate dehydrogenase
MERIVFLERNTLNAEIRRPEFPHEWREYGTTTPAEIVERLHDATIAIVNKLALRAAVLARLTQLKLIAVAATGTDNIDLTFCRDHDIGVTNVRDYAVRTLPEHVLMLTLALRRNLIAYRDDVRRGEWARASQFCLLSHPINDLHGSTMGIIGYGALGRAVSEVARALGMRVLISERKGVATVRKERTSFDEVLRTSDVLTLHAPLNDETRGMIGRNELAKMRRNSILINCARGGLVDESALVEALRSGVIGGAGVDVLSEEPPSVGSIVEEDLANLIVTPHVAWASREAMQTLADQLIANIEAFLTVPPFSVPNGTKG